MEEFTKLILERVSTFETLDYFTLAVNLLLFVLSRPMAQKYSEIKDEDRSRARLKVLHFLNFSLFLCYLLAVSFKIDVAKQVSQSFLVVLATFLLIHFIEVFLQAKYGKKLEIEGFTRNVDTHTSKTLELFCAIVILVITIVFLINLWGLESWMQKTSVLGFIALFCFATKEYWVGDFLSGIFIIGQGRVMRGDVIRVPNEDVFGIVLQTKGLQTIVRDMIRRHDVVLPNALLLRNRVDILHSESSRGVRDYIDFKLGYGIDSKKITDFLREVWDNACDTAAIDRDQSPNIALKD